MYKLNRLPDPHPYKSIGRVFLSKSARDFYDLTKKVLYKEVPDWVKSWKPGQWIEIELTYKFKNKKKFPDPNNLDTCMVNGIMKGLQKHNLLIDDAWMLLKHNPPIFSKYEGVEFNLDIVEGHVDE